MIYRTLRDPTPDEMAAMLDMLATGFGPPFLVDVPGPVYRDCGTCDGQGVIDVGDGVKDFCSECGGSYYVEIGGDNDA